MCLAQSDLHFLCFDVRLLMHDVIIGYGNHKDHKLQEEPLSLLQELAQRFPLDPGAHGESDRDDLFITIAIHQELNRRNAGGEQAKRKPTQKELALDLITKGFHILSKTFHPDRNGDNESQKRLTLAREFLRDACQQIEDDHPEGTIIICPAFVDAEITDDDIPF
jgi:hypothetical protein